MFEYQCSKLERLWLLGLRLAWQHRARPTAAIVLIDRLFTQAGIEPSGTQIHALLVDLQCADADHLYIERFDRPGLTGDERDLLAAMKACYVDDLFGAEVALSALVPPDLIEAPLQTLLSIASRRFPCLRSMATVAERGDAAQVPAMH
ncbi:MAG: hypothetical protein RQ741_04920 [Wenzhouxiangellaceae bacterium]|nr:hypothetical protein [Wenzhouxiangellaceae bacterium]